MKCVSFFFYFPEFNQPQPKTLGTSHTHTTPSNVSSYAKIGTHNIAEANYRMPYFEVDYVKQFILDKKRNKTFKDSG